MQNMHKSDFQGCGTSSQEIHIGSCKGCAGHIEGFPLIFTPSFKLEQPDPFLSGAQVGGRLWGVRMPNEQKGRLSECAVNFTIVRQYRSWVARRALIAASTARTQTAFVTSSKSPVISHSGGTTPAWFRLKSSGGVIGFLCVIKTTCLFEGGKRFLATFLQQTRIE